MENRYYQVKWSFQTYQYDNFFNNLLKRINEASGLYQMFGQLVDIISLKK